MYKGTSDTVNLRFRNVVFSPQWGITARIRRYRVIKLSFSPILGRKPSKFFAWFEQVESVSGLAGMDGTGAGPAVGAMSDEEDLGLHDLGLHSDVSAASTILVNPGAFSVEQSPMDRLERLALAKSSTYVITEVLPIAPQRSKVNAWGARCARLRLSFQTRAGTASDSESEQLTLLSLTSRLAVTLDLARPL
ncbi:hypothetical protein NDU88_010011 [Pleurodeles waltl]|uniref:Uncharacterized protein n=1 Tax=Pleurodeles waltl TaxID=8319 RepID=A0AAV7RWV1_PLEWA|nr:hypothetical protein NDU88_010011 [Pleurodeles waltl]